MTFDNKVLQGEWEADQPMDNNLKSIDINAADQKELEKIKGIGPTFAKRTIKYRNLLGGYTSKDQFNSIYGITDEALKALSDNVTIDVSAIDKIMINSASKDQIKAHPYLKDWAVVAEIISQRDKKNLNNLDFLVEKDLMSQDELNKVLPYISFE